MRVYASNRVRNVILLHLKLCFIARITKCNVFINDKSLGAILSFSSSCVTHVSPENVKHISEVYYLNGNDTVS